MELEGPQTYNSQGYPKREGLEQCSFFLKNGNCKFGTTCKNHHPEMIYAGVDFNSRGFPLHPDQEDCTYYSKFSECKYGCTCKWNHPEKPAATTKPFGMGGTRSGMTTQGSMQSGMNALGLPMRPGQTICSFYEKRGECKFGATCKWDHPELGAAQVPMGGGMVMNTFQTMQQTQGGFQKLGGSTGPPDGVNSKGLPLRHGVQMCTFFQKNGECKFGETCKWDHNENGVTLPADIFNSLGYPLRPGSQECTFFAKQSQCKFGASCKWDHPEERCTADGMHASMVSKEFPPKGTSQQPDGRILFGKDAQQAQVASTGANGLPSRPGQQACSFFMKNGTCSYGETCKWDHPAGMGGQGGGFQKTGQRPMGRIAPY